MASNLFQNNLKAYENKAKLKLAALFEQEKANFGVIEADRALLKDFLLQGGKNFRGYLMLLGYRFFKDQVPPGVIDFSLGLEASHAALLIQDDLFDGARWRRGKKAFHILLGADFRNLERVSKEVKKALLYSDLLLTFGQKIFYQAKLDPKLKITALEYLNSEAKRTAWGEILDLELTGEEEYQLAEIVKLIELKTSSYSTLMPLLGGAILAGRDQKTIGEIKKIAKVLGLLFQIRDDYLGIFGKQELLGKDIGLDFRIKKPTFLKIEGFQRKAASKDRAAWFLENQAEISRRLEVFIKRKKRTVKLIAAKLKLKQQAELSDLLEYLSLRQN